MVSYLKDAPFEVNVDDRVLIPLTLLRERGGIGVNKD